MKGHRRSRPRRPSLLILHLDVEKLRADSLHLGSEAAIAAGFSGVGLAADVAVVEGRDAPDLQRNLAALAERKRVFDVVVAIGHANAEGIVVAARTFVPWATFAAYLKPFEPRRLVLVACQAGRWPAANVLFTKLPKLRRIFASPVDASKDLANFMLLVVPYVVGVKAPTGTAVACAQAVAVALTGRQVREWRRDTDKGDSAGLLLDLAAQFADPIARQVPQILRGLFK